MVKIKNEQVAQQDKIQFAGFAILANSILPISKALERIMKSPAVLLSIILSACSSSHAPPTSNSAVSSVLAEHFTWIPHAKCEYEQLGSSPSELYVFMDCRSPDHSQGAAGVAVVALDPDGLPLSAATPGDGSLHQSDIARMFPAPIARKLTSSYLQELSKRVGQKHAL